MTRELKIRASLKKYWLTPIHPTRLCHLNKSDLLEEANHDFPIIEFEYEVSHNLPLEEYKNRYEELEHQILEILNWRFR